MPRFKIDVYRSTYYPFALYIRRSGVFGQKSWEVIDSFDSREKAIEYYQKVKDLPEYLD